MSFGCGASLIGFAPFVGDLGKASGKGAKFCARHCEEFVQITKYADTLKTTKNLNTLTATLRAVRTAPRIGYSIKKLSQSTGGLISEDRLRHILEGESGKGGHFLYSNGGMNVTSAVSVADSHGVIKANVTITHTGQLARGAVLYYNASKNEKCYYDGDLLISPSVITLSKSAGDLINTAKTIFGVTAPGGDLIDGVGEQWNAPSDGTRPIQAPGTPTSGPRNVWQMALDVDSALAPGTYNVHLTASRPAQSRDGWSYDGFLTVRIVQ